MPLMDTKTCWHLCSIAALLLVTSTAAMSMTPGAGADGKQPALEAKDIPGVNLERRTLAADSNIRERLERSLGHGRVAENLRLQVSYIDEAGFGNRSLIDQMEDAAGTQAKDFFDPWADPTLPDGPGGVPGQQGQTTAFCKPFQGPGNIVTSGNVTWTWTWMPTSDTNGDGRRTTSDSCPCEWQLNTVSVEHQVESGPLEC
jgi:hypothetical protein